MFRLFLTKINQIFVYFCADMKCYKTTFNHLIICMLCVLNASLFAQEAKTILKAPAKLDTLLQKKIALDREDAAKKRFTIQVYYGVHESTTEVLEQFNALFPELVAEMIFETPNYKIRAGSFATEREALAVLTRVKRRFKAAFVLKP